MPGAVPDGKESEMSDKAYEIELRCDSAEAAEFAAWLNSKGHNAIVGSTTESLVDGWPTRVNGSAKDVLESLWDEYCSQ